MDYCGIEYDEKAQLNLGMEYPASPEQIFVHNRAYQAAGFDKNQKLKYLLLLKVKMKESSALEAIRVCNMIEKSLFTLQTKLFM